MYENDRKGPASGWERAETLVGVPYYVNHATETTQWDHPEMTLLMNEMSLADDIKYAAYRTAVKLRAIEKKIQVDSVNLLTIRAVFNDLGYAEGFTENKINVQQLEEVLREMFTREREKGGDVNVANGVELTLNWLLNTYDQTRSGSIRIISAKIGLACLSVASVQEKYKYFFDQISSSKGFIDKKRLRVFLRDALLVLKYIKEYHSFGRSGIEPTVNSCFDRAFIPDRVSQLEYLEWMIDEPQTLVWIPTLHRLAMSETVTHEGKCNICKMFPIVGFRYRCLKCFNFDMCQNCFWSGRVAKNHKLRHQTQEYCLPATQKEDIKDFAKVIKSKVGKKKKKSTKPRYLPVTNEATTYASNEDTENVDYADNESTTSFDSHDIESERLSEAKEIPKKDNQYSSSEVLTSSPDVDDEHELISYYTSRLNNKSPAPTTSTPMQATTLERDQVSEMEQIIVSLEDDNRYLREKILDIQASEHGRRLNQSLESDEREVIEEYNKRLEARQEVLEDHNNRLEEQLTKLRHFINQKKSPHTSNSLYKTSGLQTYDFTSQNVSHVSSPPRLLNSSSRRYERLRPKPELRGQSQSTGRAAILLPPPSTHLVKSVKPSAVPKSAEDELGSGTNDGILRPSISMSSDEDLRAIEIQMEELLERESPGKDSRAESETGTLPAYADSDSSDEQQQYLLTAASMVGDAMDSLVSNLSRDQPSWNHLDLVLTGGDEEV
ncbi:dystrophin-like isoform X2 [Dendronephthya gigantea]|uniref:dystrophin-like isoform X2 n=1 Tax=Dendronephthya gigantea TaxID=151771 RepID=UPI00106AB4FD|nr:dystrophin-like isoform X2 [Dendronephthya gigantea]